MNTIYSLKAVLSELLFDLFGVDDIAIDLQETKKEFNGDITLVVFPILKRSRLSPEATAELIGIRLLEKTNIIDTYSVVHGGLLTRKFPAAVKVMLHVIAHSPMFAVNVSSFLLSFSYSHYRDIPGRPDPVLTSFLLSALTAHQPIINDH